MSWISLEWQHDRVAGVAATVGRGGEINITAAFDWPCPDGVRLSSPNAAGAWLKEQLASQKLRGERLLVSLPREDVVAKRLELPNAPDAELPDLVRFQSALKSSFSPEQIVVDFIPWPVRVAGGQRETLAATISRESLSGVQTVAKSIELKLAGLTVSSAAIAELVKRLPAVASTELSAVVLRRSERCEVSFYRDGRLLLAHAAHLYAEGDDDSRTAVTAEISRAMLALRAFEPTARLARIDLLLSPAHPELQESLSRKFSCPVQPIDIARVTGFSGAIIGEVSAAGIAGPIAHLFAKHATQAPGLDFVNPRQPPKKADPNKNRQLVYAVAGGVAALICGWWYISQIMYLDDEISKKQTLLGELAGIIKRGEPAVKSATAVNTWVDGSNQWPNRFGEFLAALPPADRVYSMKLDASTPAVADQAAAIKFEGFARERADVLAMVDKLQSQTEYLRVPPFDVSVSGSDGDYPWRFTAELQWLKPKGKAKSAGSGSETAAKKSTEANAAASEKATDASKANPPADSEKPADSNKASTDDKPADDSKPVDAEPADTTAPADAKSAAGTPGTATPGTATPGTATPVEAIPAGGDKTSEDKTLDNKAADDKSAAATPTAAETVADKERP